MMFRWSQGKMLLWKGFPQIYVHKHAEKRKIFSQMDIFFSLPELPRGEMIVQCDRQQVISPLSYDLFMQIHFLLTL